MLMVALLMFSVERILLGGQRMASTADAFFFNGGERMQNRKGINKLIF